MEPFDASNILAQEEIARHSADIYAVLTAFENDMPGAVTDILLDLIGRGEEETFEFMIVTLTSLRLLVLAVCSQSGQEIGDFLADGAKRAALMISQAEAARRDGLI